MIRYVCLMSLWTPQKLPMAFAKLSNYHCTRCKIFGRDFGNQNCIHWLWSWPWSRRPTETLLNMTVDANKRRLSEPEELTKSENESQNELTFLYSASWNSWRWKKRMFLMFLIPPQQPLWPCTSRCRCSSTFWIVSFHHARPGAPQPWPDMTSHVCSFFLCIRSFGDVVFVVWFLSSEMNSECFGMWILLWGGPGSLPRQAGDACSAHAIQTPLRESVTGGPKNDAFSVCSSVPVSGAIREPIQFSWFSRKAGEDAKAAAEAHCSVLLLLLLLLLPFGTNPFQV